MDPMLRKIINNGRYYWLANNEYEDGVQDPGEKYTDVFDKFIYTSGTPLGQIGRIKRV
jgi:hypothetical protein